MSHITATRRARASHLLFYRCPRVTTYRFTTVNVSHIYYFTIAHVSQTYHFTTVHVSLIYYFISAHVSQTYHFTTVHVSHIYYFTSAHVSQPTTLPPCTCLTFTTLPVPMCHKPTALPPCTCLTFTTLPVRTCHNLPLYHRARVAYIPPIHYFPITSVSSERIIIIIDRFYIALISVLKQTHCARM